MENNPFEFVGIEVANISVKSENCNADLEQLITQNYTEDENIKAEEDFSRFCKNNFVEKRVNEIVSHTNKPNMVENCFRVTIKKEHSDLDENIVDDYTTDPNNIKPELVLVDSNLKCETEESNSYIEENRSYGVHHVWLNSADVITRTDNIEGSQVVPFQCQDHNHDGSTLFEDRNRFENFQLKEEAAHHELKSHIWKDCDVNFSTQQKLTRHHMPKHLQVKLFSCADCDKCFTRKHRLEIHQNAIHRNVRPHKCPECDEGFTTRQILERHHQAKHLKVKPFKCPDCDKYFALEGNVKVHQQSVHRKIKPCKCPDCEQRFYNKSHLMAHHESVHRMLKPHKCSDCDNSFHSKQSLRRHHMAKHLKVRPYKCPDCAKCFSRQYLLKVHQDLVHHNIKPCK